MVKSPVRDFSIRHQEGRSLPCLPDRWRIDALIDRPRSADCWSASGPWNLRSMLKWVSSHFDILHCLTCIIYIYICIYIHVYIYIYTCWSWFSYSKTAACTHADQYISLACKGINFKTYLWAHLKWHYHELSFKTGIFPSQCSWLPFASLIRHQQSVIQSPQRPGFRMGFNIPHSVSQLVAQPGLVVDICPANQRITIGGTT